MKASLAWLSVATTAFALAVLAADPTDPAAPVTLDPFTVNTSKDVGYAAQETLAGTRLRTSLRDVANSMAILTPELLQDLAVSSLDKALLFTPSVDSVEGDNVDVNRAGSQFLRFGNGQPYSIRGFISNAGNQDGSHDFFGALVANDIYNVERITLSRGPNAMLFGVGGAQGVSVSTTKRANLARTHTSAQLQYDRWSSRRLAFDHNQPVIPGVLALRLNTLHAAKREFRLFEGNDQNRVTGGATWRPFKSTQITLNHESYSIDRNIVPLTWGFDGGILQWLAKGRPTVNFVSGGRTWAAAGRTFVYAGGRPVPAAPGVVNADGLIHSQADFDPRLALTQFAALQPTWITGLGLVNPMVNTRFQTQVRPDTFGGVQSQASFNPVDPWTLFRLNRRSNLNGGTWDDPSQREHGRWTQLFAEQKLAKDLYLELAGHLARHARSFVPDSFNIVKMDVDRYLPDGTPNPGYLVPYGETQGQYRDQLNRALEYRATLSYEYDLGHWQRWLGRQGFSALGQATRNDSDQDILRYFNLATVGRAGWSNDALAAPHIIRTRVYFRNGQVPYPLPDQFQITKNLSQLNGRTLLGSTATEIAPVNLGLRQFLNATKQRFTDDALSLAWQGKWLRDHLVTVVGYRRDITRSYGVPTVRDVIDPAVSTAATDPLSRYFTPSRLVPLNATPDVAASGASRTYGAVLHTWSWLSLTYNQSENFTPVGNASWKNFLGAPAPNSAGETKDYGVRLTFLDGRLSVSANRFVNSASDQARNANAYSTNIKNIFTRLRTNYKDRGDSHFTAMAPAGGYPADSTDVSDTWSFEARGYELNVVFNSPRGWRAMLTGSINENFLGEHLAALGRYLNTAAPFQGLATWRNYASELRKVANGQPSGAFDLNPNDAAARSQASTDATFISDQANSAERVYLDERAVEGITTHRNGKYALNGVVAYKFASDGALNGWTAGGNFRWRSANTVGYERTRDAAGLPTGVVDASRPLKGSAYCEVGAMVAYQRRIFRHYDWRLQLNVDNPLDWSKPRMVSVDYDTEGVYGATNALTPIRWELRRPRNFVLTSTVEF